MIEIHNKKHKETTYFFLKISKVGEIGIDLIYLHEIINISVAKRCNKFGLTS